MKHALQLLKGILTTREGRPTSISDRKEYVAFCAAAAVDEQLFETFRRADPIVETFEHVNDDLGRQYLEAIQRDAPDLLEPGALERALINDRAGSPRLCTYEGIGPVSPVTLRHLKVLADLRRLFGDLSGMRIAEIGVGYGGLCRLICEFWHVGSYALIDLDPVLDLAHRYLSTLGVEPEPELQRQGQVQSAAYDLVISNYAFTELERRIQDQYASDVLARADRAYITCNFISQLFGVDSWNRDELGALHTGARWLPEEPLTFKGNGILVWGDDDRELIG